MWVTSTGMDKLINRIETINNLIISPDMYRKWRSLVKSIGKYHLFKKDIGKLNHYLGREIKQDPCLFLYIKINSRYLKDLKIWKIKLYKVP